MNVGKTKNYNLEYDTQHRSTVFMPPMHLLDLVGSFPGQALRTRAHNYKCFMFKAPPLILQLHFCTLVNLLIGSCTPPHTLPLVMKCFPVICVCICMYVYTYISQPHLVFMLSSFSFHFILYIILV